MCAVDANSSTISFASHVTIVYKEGDKILDVVPLSEAKRAELLQKIKDLRLPQVITKIELIKNPPDGMVVSHQKGVACQAVLDVIEHHKAKKTTFVAGAALYKMTTDNHELGKVSKASKKYVIPISDILAVVRNIIGLAMVICLIAGLGPASAPVVILFLTFSALLIVQGFLFAVPQGWLTWGKEGASKIMIARSLKDVGYLNSGILKFFSGALSVFEGVLWMSLGVTGILPAIIMAVPFLAMSGLPAVIPAIKMAADVLTFILFNVFFTFSFAIMIPMGARDLYHHVKFRREFMKILDKPGNEADNYKEALLLLQAKMMEGKDDKAVARSLLHMEQAAGGKDFSEEMSKLEKILMLYETKQDKAELDAKIYVDGVLRDNLINIVADGLTIVLGIIGLIVGGVLYNSLHFSGHELIGQLADYIAWIFLNIWFFVLDCDPALERLTEGVEKIIVHLKRMKLSFRKKLDGTGYKVVDESYGGAAVAAQV